MPPGVGRAGGTAPRSWPVPRCRRRGTMTAMPRLGVSLQSVGGRMAALGRHRRFPVLPLFVLFGLNAVDELDRTAFFLLPDIRDAFGLTNAGALSIVSATTIAVLIIAVPLSFYCDRANRVRIATVGGGAVGLLLGRHRVGADPADAGRDADRRRHRRAVVEPTHNSLLADWYPPEARVKVFSLHRQANSVGQILGPLLGRDARLLLRLARAPFLVFAVPTAIVVLFALRLREPVRGVHERLAAGLDAGGGPGRRPAGDDPLDGGHARPGADDPADLARDPVSRAWPCSACRT